MNTIVDPLLLWGFADSCQMVIVAAPTAKEAQKVAEKYWLAGQTIVPLGILPLNAPEIAHKRVYKYDDFVWSGDNSFFFVELKAE